MKPVSADQLAKIIHGRLITGEDASCFNGVGIDSRTIKSGQAFFAIAGENFDGHDYAASAIEKGASCIVVEREIDMPHQTKTSLIKVDDCVKALAQFAFWYRQQLTAKVIAITGSVGKTTTRQMLHQVLSGSFKCRQARGSFNNHIGLPLTILSAEPEDEILLVELGSNNLGEIEQLTAIANPDVTVITAVAPSHLAGFGSLDNIIKEKASITCGLRQGGTLYVNGDQPDLLDYVKKHFGVSIITFGETDGCDVRGIDLETTGSQGSLVIDGQLVSVPLAGKANLSNVLTTWSVCRDLGVSLPDFSEAIQLLKSGFMRLEIENIGLLTVINDCYNANPVSMANALSCLRSMASNTGKREVFIAGSMAELGAQSDSLHMQLGQKAVSEGVGVLLAAGPFSNQITQGAADSGQDACLMCAFEKTEQLCDNLHKWVQPDDIILVKGSRSANLEQAVQRLRELFENH
ncbi:MAG: UDP-N-acetylmuramoyl-tripeptide--D-alanyl-D-alanine ligase [Planctomycetota bacterium]|jgi:UDP-N-acetylmuramoyl-tripeptide--D-alanyl-D-alanine ligase